MSVVSAIKKELEDFGKHLKPVPVTVFTVGALMLFVYDFYLRGRGYDDLIRPHLKTMPWHDQEYWRCIWWTLVPILALLVVPHASLRTATRVSPDDKVPTAGFGLGNWRLGLGAVLLFYAVMIPVLLIFAVPSPDFQARYPLCAEATASTGKFVFYEACLVAYFIGWEYFFRGFLTFGLEKTFGVWTIWVQMLPFVVMHFDKPDLEALSSIFAGVVLGWLALRTRSFWYGAVIHGGVDVTLDLMLTASKHFHHH
jgi:membrane protease YdiL (CAAX protease family)